MVVQHNISAMNANRYFGINNSGLSKSLEKLSSGYAINRAGDNAAGLAVSEKMRAQISGLTQASKNAEDGISMIQTFEGALQETDSILQRMRTLAVQSANGTYQDDVDREAIQLEFDQLNDELNQIADTDFNGVIVLNGGQMSDGVTADGNGKIDYSTAKRSAQQVGTAGGFVKAIGVDGYTGTTEETVTFTADVDADGKVTWTKPDSAAGALDMNDDNGGFSYAGATVHIDSTKIVAGDTVTINFKPEVAAKAHTSEVVGSTTDEGTTGDGGITAVPALTIEDDIVTSKAIADAVNALNGMTVETTTTKGSDVVSTKVNGAAIPNAADTWAEIATTEDGSVRIDQNGNINFFAVGDTTGVKIAELAEAEVAGGKVQAGTAKTVINVSQASYTPKQKAQIKVIEPEAKVSQSNSNYASTAVLTYTDNITLQAGARTKDSVNFTFAYNSNGLGELDANLDCSARGLGTDKLSLATQEDANAAIDKIDNAINKVSMVRASFGAMQNRLEHKIANLDTNNENLTAAESRIRDTDMAKEMTNFTKNQILSQASQAMLAQANQLPQGVLQLLG
ncbi:flagellin [Huintestinicola sp.]|uniref:flagellin N-terminal helical domain-containing protein n=1 Tax=Huintestinicola sp. TaxID=2981661 RepID=UPI003D7C7A8E